MGFSILNGLAAMAAWWKPLGAWWSDRRGSVAVMTAMLGVALIGFSALAVDVGTWEVNKSAMQGAADDAALAAGFAMSAGTDAAQKEAKGLAAAHGFVNGTGAVSIAVNIPPATGSYAGTANAVEVVITQPQKRLLSGVLFNSSPTASARAVVVPSQASACIMALAPTGPGIVGSGFGTIDAGSCNIYVNSPSNCDVTLSGSTTIKAYDVFLGEQSQFACTSGSASISGSDKTTLGASPAPDPYASRVIPTPSSKCTAVDTSPKTITLDPGTYCSSLVLSGNHTINLNSGVYVFDQASIVASGTSTITGTNVTLVFTSSTGSSYGGITGSGNFTLNLTPMTTGPTAGMALWFDKKGQVPFTVSGSTSLDITGAFYAPGSGVTWSGNMNSPCTQLIANNITFSGTSGFKHNCSGLGVADVDSTGSYKLME